MGDNGHRNPWTDRVEIWHGWLPRMPKLRHAAFRVYGGGRGEVTTSRASFISVTSSEMFRGDECMAIGGMAFLPPPPLYALV